jgi:peroxiredoxin
MTTSDTSAVIAGPGDAPAPAAPLREGDRVPRVRFRVRDGADWAEVSSQALFDGRTVVVFALPGAFTPTCSSQHLPRYEELTPALQRAGVDEVVCVAVNDPFVMQEWGRSESVRHVRLLPDGNAEFTRGMGMLVDKRELNFGPRSRRYSMLVRDGRIEKLFLEPDEPGDPYGVSDADTMLRYLDPDAAAPDEVAILSRPGCPFCAHAKAALDAAGLSYVDLSLPPLERSRALRAMTGAQTVPQVFVNGELVGDSQALDAWLARRRGR